MTLLNGRLSSQSAGAPALMTDLRARRWADLLIQIAQFTTDVFSIGLISNVIETLASLDNEYH